MLLSEHKNANIFKAERFWSKRGYQLPQPAALITCRQLLNTASTFTCTSKNSSAGHIHALSTCLTLTNTLIHTNTHTYTHTLSLTRSLTHSLTHKHTLTHTGTCTKKANMFKAKRLIERGGTSYSTRCPDHLSRQFPTTAPPLPFHIALKIPQPDIFTLYQLGSPSQTHSLIQSHRQIYTHTRSHRDMDKKNVNMFRWGDQGNCLK